MNTSQLMQLALDMAGMKAVPADSTIYHPGENIKRALIGIDMESPELLLGDKLGFDAVIAHHPVGNSARLNFAEVLWAHLEQMTQHGVPQAVARPLVEQKVQMAQMMTHAANYDHAPSVARLLDLPYLNVHLPLDELGRRKMVETVESLAPGAAVADLVTAFERDMPEFVRASTEIQVRVGSLENALGKVAISHAAGTNGGYAIAKAYFEHGVDTVLYIHCSPQDSLKLREEFQDRGKNLIISGHIASDAVGINLYADELEKRGLEITRISGVI